MTDDENEILHYRIEKSYTAFKDAGLLAQNNSWFSVTNRLYYAAFYMVSALLLKHGRYAKTHSGIKSLFHNSYVHSQLVEDKWGRLYQRLFDLRNDGDYSDMIFLTKDQVRPLISETEMFLHQIQKLIDTK